MSLTAKQKILEISDNGIIKKYLRVFVGSKPWRSDFYACMDHKDFSPVFEKWLAYPKKKPHKEHAKFVQISLNCLDLVNILYSKEEEDVLSIAIEKALALAKERLKDVNDESELMKLILDDDASYDWFGTDAPRIMAKATVLIRDDKKDKEAALIQAEALFDKALYKREGYLKT